MNNDIVANYCRIQFSSPHRLKYWSLARIMIINLVSVFAIFPEQLLRGLWWLFVLSFNSLLPGGWQPVLCSGNIVHRTFQHQFHSHKSVNCNGHRQCKCGTVNTWNVCTNSVTELTDPATKYLMPKIDCYVNVYPDFVFPLMFFFSLSDSSIGNLCSKWLRIWSGSLLPLTSMRKFSQN